MKKQYRFIGTETIIGDHRLTRLGEAIELTEEEAANVLGPTGAPLLTEEAFESIGFTEQELSIYAFPGQRVDAPEAFTDKMSVAFVALSLEAK